jgi:hypothetical protein
MMNKMQNRLRFRAGYWNRSPTMLSMVPGRG